MRTFFVEMTARDSSKEPIGITGKFQARCMEDAMQLMKAYAKGALVAGTLIEVTSLAAYKTRGREYEDLF